MSEFSYKGIAEIGHGDYRQLGSKFLGEIRPVSSEDEAKAFIKTQKSKFAEATHVCSAYVIGTGQETQYFSDDGEPSNSAGRPILNTLLSAGISYVVATVVRYYGGKKLGVSGLIHAYGEAARLALNSLEILDLELRDEIELKIDHAHQYQIYNLVQRYPAVELITDNGQFILSCVKSMTPQLRAELDKIPTL